MRSRTACAIHFEEDSKKTEIINKIFEKIKEKRLTYTNQTCASDEFYMSFIDNNIPFRFNIFGILFQIICCLLPKIT